MTVGRIPKAEYTSRERVPFDNYPTPVSFTRGLLECEQFDGEIWEPAAGDGHMVQVLRDAGHEVLATDIQTGDDFLQISHTVDNVVTNPPYSLALEFTFHALECTRDKVALLVKTAYLEGVARHDRLFKENPPSRVHVSTRKMFPAHKRGGGAFSHAWVVWEHGVTGPTTLDWFVPKGSVAMPEPGTPPTSSLA